MTSTDTSKDNFWLPLGKEVNRLHVTWSGIYTRIISVAFPKSHDISKLFYKLEMMHIKGELDSLVCADYPRDVRFIKDAEGVERTITSVFYDSRGHEEFQPTMTYEVRTPRTKHIFLEDIVGISRFLNEYRALCDTLIRCEYLRALEKVNPEVRYSYNRLVKECNNARLNITRLTMEMLHLGQEGGVGGDAVEAQV
jgi:hypothetical protein